MMPFVEAQNIGETKIDEIDIFVNNGVVGRS